MTVALFAGVGGGRGMHWSLRMCGSEKERAKAPKMVSCEVWIVELNYYARGIVSEVGNQEAHYSAKMPVRYILEEH